MKKCLKLLKALAHGNDLVQMRMFERLDNLLHIKVVESDLSIALKEVSRFFTRNSCFHLCLQNTLHIAFQLQLINLLLLFSNDFLK